MTENPCGVIGKVLDCCFEVDKFELQLGYYIHFQTDTLRKSLNLLIPPSMG